MLSLVLWLFKGRKMERVRKLINIFKTLAELRKIAKAKEKKKKAKLSSPSSKYTLSLICGILRLYFGKSSNKLGYAITAFYILFLGTKLSTASSRL